MAAVQMETLLKTESKPEAEKVMQLLGGMTAAQKSEMLVFMQGVCFANKMQGDKETSKAAAVQTV